MCICIASDDVVRKERGEVCRRWIERSEQIMLKMIDAIKKHYEQR